MRVVNTILPEELLLKMQNAPTKGAGALSFNPVHPLATARGNVTNYGVGDVILEPIVVNWVLSGPVISGIAAIRHTPMAAAIRPYSIAVAPDSSAKNFFILNLQI